MGIIEHSEVFRSKNGTELLMQIKTECSSKDDLKETLSFMAQSSHQFYLGLADKINSML